MQKVLFNIMILLFIVNYSIGQNKKDISFRVAKNYFVKNTYQKSDLNSPKIVTAEKFDQLFGMATIMGANGKPTSIDFTKEFVIVVINDETDRTTELIPEKLEKISPKKLNFTFETKIGEQQSSYMLPCTIIIVDRKYRKFKINLTTHSVL
jgi:hypothetical protein